MKKLIFYTLTLLIITSYCSLAQTKTVVVPLNRVHDTSLWYKWKKEECAWMKLPDLALTKEKVHFRFWEEVQLIEVWTDDYVHFAGRLVNFTEKEGHGVGTRRSAEYFYSKSTDLGPDTAKLIYDLFATNNIFNIPTQESIPGWHSGNDGEQFLMEYSTPDIYSFREYWTPSYFKQITEARVMTELVKRLEETLHIDARWGAFANQLPEGCYRAGELLMHCNQK